MGNTDGDLFVDVLTEVRRLDGNLFAQILGQKRLDKLNNMMLRGRLDLVENNPYGARKLENSVKKYGNEMYVSGKLT